MISPLLLVAALCGQEIDEAALFSDSTVVDSAPRPASVVETDSVTKTRVLFGGDVEAVGQASAKRSAVLPGSDGSARLVATASVDARLPSGQRALGVFEVSQESGADTTSWALRELFLDADAGGVVWFRAGKQVLQWGRGILWTPTDLVNVEGRTLVERPGAREGATGLRVTVPVGRGSLSAFAPLEQVDAAESLSVAVRAEAVAGQAEIALSSWFKQDAPHVVGFDASSRLLGLDVQGGALWMSGDLEPRITVRDNAFHLERDEDRGQLRASLGLGRGFKVNGVPDRLRIDLEGFFQTRSYGSTILALDETAPYADTVWKTIDPRLAEAGASMGLPMDKGIPITRGDALGFLAGHGLYHPMNHGPYYLGAMASFQKVWFADLSATLQGLSNLDDRSGLATFALQWESLHGFHVQPIAYWFWGDKRTEFTLDGRGIAAELRAGLRF